MLCLAMLLFVMSSLDASSHREAPLISTDPLADNVDVYAFRSPDDQNTITLIATYVPFQLPHGGPNYYSFGENIRYEVHVDNDASVVGDEVTYRFTFNVVNEDPTTFFNLRLGAQNQKTTYTLERSMDGGATFQTIITDGIVPPNNIGERSISGAAGLNTDYNTLWNSAINTASSGERVFAGPTDDPFFVDLGGIFDLGDAPRQNGTPVDGLGCYNVSAIAIQVPISTLLKVGAPTEPENILDPNYVIGVWASASRPALQTISATGEPVNSGDWVQVSRLGMPLTNEAVIPIGFKDYWNALTPYQELAETEMDEFFYNPELALYMDDDQFGGAVPAFGPLRIQTASLGAFDFTNGADGVSALAGGDLTGTAFEVYGDLLLRPGQPRSVDLWPIFHTGVPNAIPYQLATGKGGNPVAAGKPFINNFLPNGGDMLRLNMAVPVTPRDDPNFSSLGLVQAAAIGLTVAPFNTTADLEFIPNMDGFPNGRRLEDDVTRIELQAVGGVVLAAVGLWYDDYDPMDPDASPVTEDLLGVLTYTTGVEENDVPFTSSFPYLAQPRSGTGECSGEIYNSNPPDEGEDLVNIFVSSNTTGTAAMLGVDDTDDVSFRTFDVAAMDADGIYYSSDDDVLYQLNRTDNVVNAYRDAKMSIDQGNNPTLTATSTSDFINGREITVSGNTLVVAQDANDANGQQNKFVVYSAAANSIVKEAEYTTDLNLWGIQMVGDALYAIEDNSDRLAIFENFASNADGSDITADRLITVEGIVRTHGLTVDTDNNTMILTDVGSGAVADDGAVVIVRDYITALENGTIESSEQVRVAGANTLLGNPVDVAYDYTNDLIYIAERANGGGRILAFDGATAGGDVAPSYSRDFAGASAIYFSDLMDPIVELETVAQFFTSSNTEAFATAYDIKENGSVELRSFAAAMDADGIHYDAENDVLYELDRTNNVINIYGDVNASLDNNDEPAVIATSTSDFSNGREITVMGDQLVVAQDASDANGMTNKLVVYTMTPTSVTYEKEFETSFNLWGIQFTPEGTLAAIVDNSNQVAIIEDFMNLSTGSVVDGDAILTVEGIVRTHGLHYDAETDLMILTDVGSGADPADGALIYIADFEAAADDLNITSAEQVRIEGVNTNLGNPVDVAYDRANNVAYVAERANEGGRVLGFEVNELGGNVFPIYNVLSPGVSAIFLGNADDDVMVVVPEINIFDPNFSDDILISARMTGGNEVPAVTTDAIGVATVTFSDDYTMATLNATVSGLSSDFMGAHIHLGFPGENGDVVFNLTDDYFEGRVTSTFPITKDDVALFIDGGYYLNVHSVDNPGGELRGNLKLEAAESFVVQMEGGNEVPTVEGDGLGIAMLHYTSNTNVLEIKVQTTDLTGPITGIHLHMGAEGENGDVVQNLTPSLVGNTVNVKLQAGDYIDALRSGNIYLNVHTEANPAGEIRGNIFPVEGLVFDAWLAGSQEVPAVGNDGFGLAIGTIDSDLSSIVVAVVTDNLSGDITGAHFHNAPLGENGDVVLNLTDFADGTFIDADDIEIDDTFLSNYLSGDLYVNIHTASFPAGEIRGQVYRIARDGYAYDVCQEQEIPEPVGAGNAAGSGMLAFNRDFDEMHLMVVANELSSEFQGSHIHAAPLGENGDVVFNFTDRWADSGSFFYVTDEFTSELAGIIQAGNTYVNVHTTNNPAGELRGQVVKEPNCPLMTSTFNIGNELIEATIYPNPTATDITLELTGDQAIYNGAQMSITDLNGRVLMNTTLNGATTRINTRNFDSGIYLVTIKGDNYIHAMKFTKVK